MYVYTYIHTYVHMGTSYVQTDTISYTYTYICTHYIQPGAISLQAYVCIHTHIHTYVLQVAQRPCCRECSGVVLLASCRHVATDVVLQTRQVMPSPRLTCTVSRPVGENSSSYTRTQWGFSSKTTPRSSQLHTDTPSRVQSMGPSFDGSWRNLRIKKTSSEV